MPNQLIDESRLAEQQAAARVVQTEETKMTKGNPAPARCWLFSEACPAGEIFKGEDAIARALEDGWSDTPPKNAAELQAAAEAEDRVDELLLLEENEKLQAQVAAQEKDLHELRKQLDAATKAAPKGKGKGAGK